MAEIEFVDTEDQVSYADIDEIEKRLGFSFPDEFRVHYLRFNGGSPCKYIFKHDDVVLVVSEFLPLKHGKHLLEDTFRNLKITKTVLPKHFVPFAIDAGGDYFCFSTKTGENGSIWLFRGEYSDNPARARLYLSSSLLEFFDRLTDDED